MSALTIPSLGLKTEGVDSAYLDCLRDNVAVLLRHRGVIDLRTPLAFQWRFAFDGEGACPEPELEDVSLEEALPIHAGCAIRKHALEPGDLVEQILPWIQARTPVLIFGDAALLPWLPYFGHERMEHTFIVDGVTADGALLHIVDAYENKTEWGEATPVQTALPSRALAAVVDGVTSDNQRAYWTIDRVGVPLAQDMRAITLENAERIRCEVGEGRSIHRFAAHHAARKGDAAAMKALTLSCWLIARTRGLHALWLAERPAVLPPGYAQMWAETVAEPWRKAAEYAYILQRRVSQGRTAPDTCFQMIEALGDAESQAATILLESSQVGA